MANTKKLIQAAAGAAAGGAGLDVNDVFSIYTYVGDGGSNRDISNGIDLSTEGGMVWWRPRDNTDGWGLIDTERGAGKNLRTHGTFAEYTDNGLISAFNTDGYRIGGPGGSYINASSTDYASYSFRKAPKFFDVVTYTGNGTAGRTVSHNLGSTPGMIIIKSYGGTYNGNWAVYHRGLGETKNLRLDTTAAADTRTNYFNDTAPTATQFTLGTNAALNYNGETYVAYLFAHNDGDGNFGPDGDQDIIKCGSFTSDGDISVDLGFEPEWLLVKRTDSTGDWKIFDTMRGFSAFNEDRQLRPNSTAIESDDNFGRVEPTGFQSEETSGTSWIYVAIRKGPLSPPTDASNVFAIATRDAAHPSWESGFPVDFAIRTLVASTFSNYVGDKLTMEYYATDLTTAGTYSLTNGFDSNEGWSYAVGNNTNYYSWMWRRAPHYYDTVTYIGNGTSGRTVNHNLGVIPEMMWVKRISSAEDWAVYHKDLATDEYLALNQTDAVTTTNGVGRWNNTRPTSSVFTLGNHNTVNALNNEYVCHLFGTVDGVSKVGSYTGDGTNGQTIDCGFTAGAKAVFIKRYDTSMNWFLMDTDRGISAGTDPLLTINSNAPQYTSADSIDPHNSGFIVNNDSLVSINVSGASYIFYAIA